MVWSIVSKAADKSSSTNNTTFCWSIAINIIIYNFDKSCLCAVELIDMQIATVLVSCFLSDAELTF